MVQFNWICDLDIPPVGQCIGYNSTYDTFHFGAFDDKWLFRVDGRLVQVDYYLKLEDLRKCIKI